MRSLYQSELLMAFPQSSVICKFRIIALYHQAIANNLDMIIGTYKWGE